LFVVFAGCASQGVVGQAVGVVSDRLKTAFTPAGAAFSIWGVIYTLAVLAVAHMTYYYDQGLDRYGAAAYVTLVFNLVLNGVWIFLWTNPGDVSLVLSVVLMLGILGSLMALYRMAGPAAGFPAKTWLEMLTVRAFISVYFGWISVATIANIAGAATPLDGDTVAWGLGAPVWASVMVLIASGLAVLVSVLFHDCGYPAVIAWASWWVATQQSVAGWPGTETTVACAHAAFGIALCGVALALALGARRMFVLKQAWQPAWPSLMENKWTSWVYAAPPAVSAEAEGEAAKMVPAKGTATENPYPSTAPVAEDWA
jgi:hypothetical protein